MDHTFFEKINYSACNEDSESERKALRLAPGDTVLCITGSGARPLDLLVDSPGKIISVDFNASQNHLLALKIAAYQALDYGEFRAFIGLDNHRGRQALFEKLKPRLTVEQLDYWMRNFTLIENGLLYCGTWEKLLAGMNRMAFFRRKKISKLLEARDLEEQRMLWNTVWKNASWRFFLKIITYRFLWTKIIREPGAKLIPKDFDVYAYMSQRLDHLAQNHLLRPNHFANLIFCGAYRSDCLLPLHLREEHFSLLKGQVDKIEIVTDSLSNVLQNAGLMNEVTAFSLSDFSSYSTAQQYNQIWHDLLENARKDSRFCERFFLVKRSPEKLSPRIHRNPLLEQHLLDSDTTALYTFCVGTIH